MERSKKIGILLIVTAIIRALLAWCLELGNDEVYYWTYAMYPDWSHFDHPGMVGWMMQLFSFDLLLDSEFFLRLSSVVFMTFTTWIVYRIGCEIKDQATGWRAALLYTGSIYASIITGVFIMPDGPMALFWWLAFWMFLKYIHASRPIHLLLGGLFTGLCILSKYTGAFLWVGFGLYVILYDRKQFSKPWLYLAALITAVCCLPIVIWNAQNGWASFGFHGDRVGLFGPICLSCFGTELAGELFYNNPINVVIGVLAIIAIIRKKLPTSDSQHLILLTALPMISIFLIFSLSHPTLPHWSGPAYSMLILLSACYLKRDRWAWLSAALLGVIIIGGVVEIKTGIIPLDRHTEETNLGKDDFTLDMCGWRQAGEKFATLREKKIAAGEMKSDDDIIGNNWFPTANIDYYIARPLGMNVLGYGPIERIHKYAWTNDKKGGFEVGKDYWYIADSHYFVDPEIAYAYSNFHSVEKVGVIPIERNGRTVRNLIVYECKGLVYGPQNFNDKQ